VRTACRMAVGGLGTLRGGACSGGGGDGVRARQQVREGALHGLSEGPQAVVSVDAWVNCKCK
jgi:hypothetical protein